MAGTPSLVRRSVHAVRRRLRAPGSDPFAHVRSLDGPQLVTIPPIEREPGDSGAGRLVVLLPHLQLGRMTGGPNTALNLAGRVALAGTPVRVVATHGPVEPSVDALRAHVSGLVGRAAPSDALTFESIAEPAVPLRLRPLDVPMATWWPTAHIARASLSAVTAREFLYLVQDFEPGFYAWSSNYALALETYTFPIRALCNESLVRAHLRSLGIGAFGGLDERAIAFEPAVDRNLFAPRERVGPRTLLFYARPRNPRNAFELGLRSLRVAVASGAFDDDWEFRMIGDQVPELRLDARRVIKPVPWQSMSTYAELLSRSDLLLSLMLSPHTSYPPLEMAASGGHVVTNTFGVKNAAALRALTPGITAVPPDVESIASALAGAASRPRPDAAAPVLRLPRTWDEALDPVVAWVRDAVREMSAA
jgi:hypothetical protein